MHSSGKDLTENEIKGPFLKTLEGDCTNFLSLFITFTLDPSDFILLLNLLWSRLTTPCQCEGQHRWAPLPRGEPRRAALRLLTKFSLKSSKNILPDREKPSFPFFVLFNVSLFTSKQACVKFPYFFIIFFIILVFMGSLQQFLPGSNTTKRKLIGY